MFLNIYKRCYSSGDGVDAVLLGASYLRIMVYNKTVHRQTFSGQSLFGGAARKRGLSVVAVPRESTWTNLWILTLNNGIKRQQNSNY